MTWGSNPSFEPRLECRWCLKPGCIDDTAEGECTHELACAWRPDRFTRFIMWLVGC